MLLIDNSSFILNPAHIFLDLNIVTIIIIANISNIIVVHDRGLLVMNASRFSWMVLASTVVMKVNQRLTYTLESVNANFMDVASNEC